MMCVLFCVERLPAAERRRRRDKLLFAPETLAVETGDFQSRKGDQWVKRSYAP